MLLLKLLCPTVLIVLFGILGILKANSVKAKEGRYFTEDDDLRLYMRWNSTGVGIALAISLPVLYIINKLVGFHVSLLWFDQFDAGSVIATRAATQVGLLFSITTVAVVFFCSYAWRTYRLAEGYLNSTQIEKQLVLVLYILALCVIVAFLWLITPNLWDDFQLFLHNQDFGQTDPVHHKDIGFYVFVLPWWKTLVFLSFCLWLLTFVACGIVSMLSIEEETDSVKFNFIMLELVFWGSVIAFFHYNLSRYSIVSDGTSSEFTGASLADLNVRMTLYWIGITLFGLLGGFTLITRLFRYKGQLENWGGVYLTIVAIYLLSYVTPGIYHSVIVGGNTSVKEHEQLVSQIETTQWAYGIENIVEQEIPYEEAFTAEQYSVNDESLSATRIMDWPIFLAFANSQKEIKTYYEYPDTDLDWYGDGLLMMALREMDDSSLSSESQTWQNKRLVYTHGNCFIAGRTNTINPTSSFPELVFDIPDCQDPNGLSTLVPAAEATNFDIYFGELSKDWIIINTDVDEIAPSFGSTARYSRYEGSAGFELGNPLNRLALAWKFNDLKLLTSSALTSESRLIWQQNIVERINTLAPFLTLDADPYFTFHDGEIYWIIDAFTTASNIPYSERFSGNLNYIRNSVKITISAYEGVPTFYVMDDNDPVLKAWMEIHPDLNWQPAAEMPATIQEHLRYSEYLLQTQAGMLGRYHLDPEKFDDPEELTRQFYNREDVWAIPFESYGTTSVQMVPRFQWLRLPGEETNEAVLALPFTPNQKQNLVAWLAARIDGEHYGELRLMIYPRDETVTGPQQAESSIQSYSPLTSQISLWNAQSSQVVWGNLITHPVIYEGKTSLVYIKPLYLTGTSYNQPKLTRVIGVIDAGVVIEAETLPELLNKLYTGDYKNAPVTTFTQPIANTAPIGQPDLPQEVVPLTDANSLAEQAIYYEAAARQCLIDNDWTCYGANMAELQARLYLMLTPTPSPN